jgi:methylthioribose-1-phosphate isomerase
LADSTASMTDPTDSADVAPLGPDEVAPTPTPSADGVDLGRRRFFRQFAGEIANTAATVMGAAQAIQRTSAELAGAILDPTRLAEAEPVPGVLPESFDDLTAGTGAAYRTSFRLDGQTIRFVDQRALPSKIVEHPATSAGEVCWAIRDEVVQGGPAIGQAAAFGLALTAERVAGSKNYARRATLRGAANALINASLTHASIPWAVDRLMAVYTAIGELDEDGARISSAMFAEAELIVAEARDDHGRLVDAGLALLADLPRGGGETSEPLRLLVHGQSGTLAGGQFGTALAIAIAAHHADRPVRVIVPEARPGFAGARVSCWELASAGVPHLLIVDAAAPALIADGEVDAVLVPADRVASNGDVAATTGTYALAVAAARQTIPFLVCAPASAIDPRTADGAAIPIVSRTPDALERVGDLVLAPRGTEVRIPSHDITPAELVTSYITGRGIQAPPFLPAAMPVGADDPASAMPPTADPAMPPPAATGPG